MIGHEFSRNTVFKYKPKTTEKKNTNQWKAIGDGHWPNKEKKYLSVKEQLTMPESTLCVVRAEKCIKMPASLLVPCE